MMPRSQATDETDTDNKLSFLLDLDGTLVDSVYRHVLAWQEAFRNVDLNLSGWRIHRRIGMSGSLLVRALLRAGGREAKEEEVQHLEQLHGEAYERLVSEVEPLPGAKELLAELSRLQVKGASNNNFHG